MKYLFFIFLLTISFGVSAQVVSKDTLTLEKKADLQVTENKKVKSEIEILDDIELQNAKPQVLKLSPIKAGLYSAVLPGLGQYYNKKYWKVPIVWGAVGTGVGVAMWNQKQYNRYRNAFVAELNGQPHEFSGIQGIDKRVLGNAQDRSKRQRDYAIGITALIYILNIVDAVVDAHLYESRHDPDLAITPTIIQDKHYVQQSGAGISLSYRF
ncbi:DUF5683 domain-containing protein [Chryseobacterium sp. T1]